MLIGGVYPLDVRDFLVISSATNDCPNCGNCYIGNGEGALEVKENIFRRTCKCGFKFEFNTDNRVNKKAIKKAVTDALERMIASQ